MDEAISRKEAELEHLKNDLLALRGKIPDHITKSFSQLSKSEDDLEAFLSIGKLISTSRPQAARTFQPPQPSSLAQDWSSFEKMIEKDETSDLDVQNEALKSPIDKRQWSYDPSEGTFNGDGDQNNERVVRCKSCHKLLVPSVFQTHFEKCKGYTEKKEIEAQEMKAQMLTLEMNKNKRKRLIDDGPAPFQRKPKQQHVAPETEDTYLQTDIGKLTSLLFYETVSTKGPPTQETISKVLSTIAENKPKPLNGFSNKNPNSTTFPFQLIKPTPLHILHEKQNINFRNPYDRHLSHPMIVIEDSTGNGNLNNSIENLNEIPQQNIVAENENNPIVVGLKERKRKR